MSVSDKVFIRVDKYKRYNKFGKYMSLTDIYTIPNITSITASLFPLKHPVLSMINNDDSILAYEQPYSTDLTSFVNVDKRINMYVKDTLADAMTPVLEKRLYKQNVDYPLIHPYMLSIINNISSGSNAPVSVAAGTYLITKWGTSDGKLNNVGALILQGAGGGSGGTNASGADAAGGGGGSGGCAVIYYRVKNLKEDTDYVKLVLSIGSGGSAGGATSGDGGGGGATKATFTTPLGKVYTISANGGGGGQTGDRSYNAGGSGGTVTSSGCASNISISGGQRGNDSYAPGQGGTKGLTTLVNDEYIHIALLYAHGGSGGGRGDDTSGGAKGQSGSGISAKTLYLPVSQSTDASVSTSRAYTLASKSGGSVGASVTDAQAGGGGASHFSNGAAGGGKASSSSTAKAGSNGAGAGGAGCGENEGWKGAKGGNGLIYKITLGGG